jgi:hypothetical protein
MCPVVGVEFSGLWVCFLALMMDTRYYEQNGSIRILFSETRLDG